MKKSTSEWIRDLIYHICSGWVSVTIANKLTSKTIPFILIASTGMALANVVKETADKTEKDREKQKPEKQNINYRTDYAERINSEKEASKEKQSTLSL